MANQAFTNGLLALALIFGIDTDQRSGTPRPVVFRFQSDGAQTDLPQHAITRFGKHGKESTDNGYYRLVFSPNGKYLAARNRQNVLEIYDVPRQKPLCQVEGDDALINTVDFASDSELFLTASSGPNEKVKIWSTPTGNLVGEIDSDAAIAYFLENDDQLVALTDEHVATFNWRTGKLLSRVRWKKDNHRAVALSRDGKQVVVSRALRKRLYQLQVLDLETRSKTILDGPAELTKAVQISPNSLWLAASYSHRDPNIRLWDLRDPHEEKFVLRAHKNAVQSLAFSEDGRFLVSTSWDQTVIVWDLLSKEIVGKFEGHTENVNSSAFCSINWRVASGASGRSDSSILIWDLNQVLFEPREFPRAFDSFEVVWKELGSNFPDQAFLAMQALMHQQDRWVEKVASKIGLATRPVSPSEISTWIEQLDDKKFQVREAAMDQLMQARGAAESQLQEALANPSSTEVEYRIHQILRRPIRRPKIRFDELRRLHRSIFALELIGTPAAQRVMANISQGHANIDVARDAADSLERSQFRAAH